MARQLALFLILVAMYQPSGLSLSPDPHHVRIVPGSVKSGTFKVKKGADGVTVESREFEVQVELSKGTVKRYVSVLYDPTSRLLWWNTDSTDAIAARGRLGASVLLPRDSAICLTESKFVLFWNGWSSGGRILIRESNDRFPGLDEGVAFVLSSLEAKRGDIESGRFLHEYREVQFPNLDDDFLFARNVANPVGPTLGGVKRIGNEWHITENSPNGGSALIVLDDEYKVLKTTILSSK